ncbi:hypothetical protein [Lysobacter soli]|uniref:hypothetical protein n=1 Tax=Lysobacter soli TaxID=453783 RepID=UPI00240FAB5F|nr:hypothetical protein [Lysobacter soli]MDG2519694.1 hypothetical protein [Lysobacter soli]
MNNITVVPANAGMTALLLNDTARLTASPPRFTAWNRNVPAATLSLRPAALAAHVSRTP